MADEPTKTPGSITQKADNSNERISEISNVNLTISNMQKKVDQQLGEMSKNIGNAEAISSVQNSMTNVLQKLSTTVGDIGKGFGKVSVDVAKSSKDVISQYGRAISQDINYNKQNIVAMALSKSTPIYGYFISKFMETDVWKSASARMKENISNTLSSVGQKLKNVIGDMKFSKKSKKDTDSLSKQTRSIKVPHMAKGGVVEKAGLAKLHAAEVVMPVDKLLSRIDEQLTLARTMAKNVEQGQLHTMSKMNQYVGSLEQYQKRGLVKGFFTALREVQTQYEEPAWQRMLRALLAIQDALGAQIGTWTQVWQKMLVQNPVFRNAMLAGNLLKKTLAAPFAPVYSIFKQRGGYKGHLSRSKSPLEALNENMGLLYTGSMFRMDAIATYTRATAEATRDISSAITGASYEALPGIKTGKWSLFGMARKLLNFSTKFIVKSIGNIISIPMEYAHLGPKLDKLADVLTKQIKIPKGGFAKYQENIYGKGKEEEEKEEKLRRVKEESKSQYSPFWGGLSEFFSKKDKGLRVTNTNQKEIDNTSKKLLKITDKNYRQDKKEFKISKKALNYAEANLKENKQANERGRRQSIFGFLSGGFGAVKGLLGGAMGFIKPLLAGGIGALIGGGILASVGTFLASSAFLVPLGIAVASALVGKAGYEVGKWLNKPITERLDKYYAEGDERGAAQRVTLAEKMQAAKEGMKSGGWEGYENKMKMKIPASMGSSTEKARKNVGFIGRLWFDQIRDAQHLWQMKNINEYMPYSYETIEAMRSEWIDKGGFRVSKWQEDMTSYGKQREWSFLQYLKEKGTPISFEEEKKDYSIYNKQIKSGMFGKPKIKAGKPKKDYFSKDRTFHGDPWRKEYKDSWRKPQIKDSDVGMIINTTDTAKQQTTNAAISMRAVLELMRKTADNAINATKDAARNVGDAVNQSSIGVMNTITNNTSSTVMNGSNRDAYNMEEQYNRLLIRGDADGD